MLAKAFLYPRMGSKTRVIGRFFWIDSEGMHLKAYGRDICSVMWPDALGKFWIPSDCTRAEVMPFYTDDALFDKTVLKAQTASTQD